MSELVRARLGGSEQRDHSSRLLTGDMLRSADLILAAEHSHLADIGRLVPSAAPRSFTLRIAAHLAATVVSPLREHTTAPVEPARVGRGRNGAVYASPGPAALPPAGAVDQRLQWLVAEMNEIRGVAAPTVPQPRRRAPLLRRRRDEPETPASDVPDPHAFYRDIHRESFILLSAAVDTFTGSVRDLLAR